MFGVFRRRLPNHFGLRSRGTLPIFDSIIIVTKPKLEQHRGTRQWTWTVVLAAVAAACGPADHEPLSRPAPSAPPTLSTSKQADHSAAASVSSCELEV